MTTYTLTYDQLWDLVDEAKTEGKDQGFDTYGTHRHKNNDQILTNFFKEEKIVVNVGKND